MKEVKEEPRLLFRLEKDDSRNITGMQLKVWSLRNNTVILLRVYDYNRDGDTMQKFIEKNQEVSVSRLLLDFILDLIIKETKGKSRRNPGERKRWEIGQGCNSREYLAESEDFEDKDMCFYFSWQIKEKFILSSWYL